MTDSGRQDTDTSTQLQYENWHYTRCPHCEVVFRVDRNKLKVRQGEVRCGACREVFHAPTNRVFRNHGGGFSTLIADPLLQDQPAETVAEGSSMSVDDGVLHNDPFSKEFSVPQDAVIKSTSLFRDAEPSAAAVETGNSRLFRDNDTNDDNDGIEAGDADGPVAFDPSVDSGIDEPSENPVQESTEQPVQIPKISSEPLFSRPRDTVDTGDEASDSYREPALSSAVSANFSGPASADPEQNAEVPAFASTPEEVARARTAYLASPEPETGPDVATLAHHEEEQFTDWHNDSVQRFGASAMPMPPSFEPFVPPQSDSVDDKDDKDDGNDRIDPNSWTSQEDSLLDHNPFARNEITEEPVAEPAKVEIEPKPRPAAINMSGVDEYIVDRPNPIAGFFWFLVSAAFVVLLGLQVKYFLVERFAQNETYRPYLQVFCGVARCELPPRKDAYRFTITQTRVDLHPREPGALRITVRLLNQAKFAQPYPELRLTLTDRVGRVVGRRKFDPDTYLAKASATRLAPGELGYVIFDLAQPHEKAVGFVVDVVRRSS